jgi:histidinol-phosphate aminotransferase
MLTRVPLRDDLLGVEPYGAPQLDVRVRLNINETPEPPPAVFMERLAARVRDLALHRYPDRRAWALRAALGRRVGLPPERVWAANGSNEVLLQLFTAYGGPGRRLLLTRPGYSAHPLIARVAGTDSVHVDLDSDLLLSAQAATDAVERLDPDLVCLASPNNPTGMPFALDVVRAVHDAGRALVVVDEAYVEFAVEAAEGGEVVPAISAVNLLDELPRLVVCRTFSKAFRMAGVRLGYCYTHDWVVDDLRKVRLPYHLDAMTQAAGLVACELAAEVTDHIGRTVRERERVRGALAALDLRVWPSAANFLLFRPDTPDVFQGLLDRGVLIRDFTTAPGLDGCLRVSIGTPTENDAFLDALREVLQ